jgi:thiol-disulfide isomerase/thioredoxin
MGCKSKDRPQPPEQEKVWQHPPAPIPLPQGSQQAGTTGTGASTDPTRPSPKSQVTSTDVTSRGVTVQQLKVPGSKDDQKAEPKRWLGISVANMREPIEGAPEDARAMVQRAFRGGPAHATGLQRGDVIVKAAGAPVRKYQDYLAQARKVDIGQAIALEVLRDGKPQTVQLTMIDKPDNAKEWRKKHFPGTPAMPWSVMDLGAEGGLLDSSQAQGRPQLLYFWATWCAPCRKTSPMVDRLHQDVGDRLHLVAVSSEEEVKLRPWLNDNPYSYPTGHDSKGLLKLDYEVKSLPTIVLISASGTILAWDYGTTGVSRVVAQARTLSNP